MLISKVIAELQKFVKENGDLKVADDFLGWGSHQPVGSMVLQNVGRGKVRIRFRKKEKKS